MSFRYSYNILNDCVKIFSICSKLIISVDFRNELYSNYCIILSDPCKIVLGKIAILEKSFADLK